MSLGSGLAIAGVWASVAFMAWVAPVSVALTAICALLATFIIAIES